MNGEWTDLAERGVALSESKANLARRVRELETVVARQSAAINAAMLELQDPDRPVDRDQIWRTLHDATGSCGV
jgi:hypothetical protein